MSKRVRITALITTLCLCISLFVVGVLAAKSVSFSVTSKFSFKADGVYVMVDAKLKQGVTLNDVSVISGEGAPSGNATYKAYSYKKVSSGDQPNGEASSQTFLNESGTAAGEWTIGNINFSTTNKIVVYEFSVSNYSEFEVSATVTGNLQTELQEHIEQDRLTLQTYVGDTATSSPSFSFNIPKRVNDTTPGIQTYKIVVTLTSFTKTFNTNQIEINFDFKEYVAPQYTIEQENIGGKDYTFVYFGNYPQTYVGNALNTTLENAFDANSSALTATGKTYTTYDAGVKITGDNSCKEYEYNGELFARVPKADVYTSGAKTFKNGTTVVNGSTYWFKVEPIKWRVLTTNYTDAENTTPVYYLLSEFCLTANTTFNPSSSNTNANYYSSNTNALRPFLNNEFCSEAFTEAEQTLIATRTLKDADMDGTGSVGDIPSTEPLKVWAPSRSDMIKTNYGFNSSPSNYDQQRRASATDFAMVNYAYKDASNKDIYGIGGAYYWTSSAASSSTSAYYVYFDGYVASYPVNIAHYTARPALLFNI